MSLIDTIAAIPMIASRKHADTLIRELKARGLEIIAKRPEDVMTELEQLAARVGELEVIVDQLGSALEALDVRGAKSLSVDPDWLSSQSEKLRQIAIRASKPIVRTPHMASPPGDPNKWPFGRPFDP